ncbi:hypothetical protein ACSBR1_004749 [Camellia fascicularis]
MVESTETRSTESTSNPTTTRSSRHCTPVSHAKFEVEKFDGSNFGIWKCKVKDKLVQMNLHFTLGDKPESLDEFEWEKVNLLTCSSIQLCLAQEEKYAFIEYHTTKELWKVLQDKFMTKNIENRLYLKKRLFCFDYKKGISMNEHLDNFNKILADLKNLDVRTDDEDKALLLLNSLPDTYDHLTTTLLYGKEKIKYVDVSNALVNNELRRKDKSANRDSASEALTVKDKTNNRRYTGRGKSRSKSKGRSSDRRRLAKDECAACRQKGHWAKYCLNKDKKEEKVTVARDGDNGEGSAFTISSLGHFDEWILDSRCAYHMRPNK